MIIGLNAAASSNLLKVHVASVVGQNVMDMTKKDAMELRMLAFFVDGRATGPITEELLVLHKSANTHPLTTAIGA